MSKQSMFLGMAIHQMLSMKVDAQATRSLAMDDDHAFPSVFIMLVLYQKENREE
jgi:hypothetical protein